MGIFHDRLIKAAELMEANIEEPLSLDELAAAIVNATDGLGTLAPRPAYNGHITVARVKRDAIVRKVVGMLCASSFKVIEVALVESRLHPTGSTYSTLESWPVARAAE